MSSCHSPDTLVRDVDLTTRTRRALGTLLLRRRSEPARLLDVAALTQAELMSEQNFSRVSLAEVRGVLARAGLRLAAPTRGGPTDAERFWSRVKRGAEADCWEWAAARAAHGYGHTHVACRGGRRQMGAHRRAWELTHGPIPDGLCVCHRCDNPPCCNPAHLFLGTPADNNADMVAKGRARSGPKPPGSRIGRSPGERNAGSKLTEANVREIRAMLAMGVSRAAVASAYGVSIGAIRRIHTGEGWSHVAGRAA